MFSVDSKPLILIARRSGRMVARLDATIATPGSISVQTMASVPATWKSQLGEDYISGRYSHRISSVSVRSARNRRRTRVATLALDGMLDEVLNNEESQLTIYLAPKLQ